MDSYPEEWRIASVGDIANGLKSGLSRKLSPADIGLPVLRSNNLMNGGGIDYTDIKYWYVDDPQGAKTENYVLVDGDLLINFINSISAIGKASIYHDVLGRNVIYTTNIMCLRVKRKSILPHYFLYLTQTEDYNQYIQAITKPAVNQASFTTVDFKNWEFPLPPLPEQRKIAQILGTWDEAIATTEKLIAALERRKQGLMQRLLTGQVRFGEFAGSEWREVRLGDILDIQYGKSPSEIRNDDGEFLIWGTGGIVGRTNAILCEQPAIIIGRKGTIDRPQLVTRPFWAIDTTFYCTVQETIDIRWLFHLLDYAGLARYNEASGVPSLARNTLYSIAIQLPSKEEQVQIADVLEKSSSEINAHQDYKQQLMEQKKGLMQRLLTGQVRVAG